MIGVLMGGESALQVHLSAFPLYRQITGRLLRALLRVGPHLVCVSALSIHGAGYINTPSCIVLSVKLRLLCIVEVKWEVLVLAKARWVSLGEVLALGQAFWVSLGYWLLPVFICLAFPWDHRKSLFH